MKVRLAVPDDASRVAPPTDDLEAYTLYLKGRHFWNQRSERGLRNAIATFQAAIEKDPGYAAAFAGLADAYALLSFYTSTLTAEAIPKAKAAAERALELDPRLAEAHASLATIKTYFEWDWTGAEREYHTAIELNPNYATAHQWLSEHLQMLGRFDEALAEARLAQRLDPLAPVINLHVASALTDRGDLDQALEQYRSTLELDPTFGQIYTEIGELYLCKRSYPAAIEALEKGVEHSSNKRALARLGYGRAVAGQMEEARRILAALEREAQTRYVPTSAMALIHVALVALGEKELSFELLESAYAQHELELAWINVDPLWDPVRAEPRFQRLLRRIGFPPAVANDPLR